MKQSTTNINTSEVIIVVINSILGAGILTLPRTISKAVGTPDVWIAYLLGLLIIVYFVVLCSFEVRVMAEITSMYILERTPTWVTIMVSLWIGIYM